ncbi:cytidine and deoxycytidylate deaminase zinc-binding region, partial [Oesophagostomum dentatum]
DISAELLQSLKEFGIDEKDFGGLSFLQVAKVAATKPATRRQFDWAKQYWPTSFHPDKELESLLDDTFFTEQQKQRVFRWCERAIQTGNSLVVQDDKELASGSKSDRLLGHPIMTMVQNLAKCQRREGDYLATGCDVFLKDEPCAMCAMALVHCRAARVFFCRNTENGVLAQGKWQLHLEPTINHHYRVFHVDLMTQDEGPAVCGT